MNLAFSNFGTRRTNFMDIRGKRDRVIEEGESARGFVLGVS